MNVLILHNKYQRPGGEDVVVNQESELLRRYGHQVTLYLRSNDELQALSLAQRLQLLARITYATDSQSDVQKLLRDLKPDIVHVHNTFAMLSPSVYDACQKEDVPVVQSLHNYRLLCPAATFYRHGDTCQECVTHGLLSSVRHACYRDSRAMSAAVALMLKTHRVRRTWEQIDAYIALSGFQKSKFVQCGFPAGRIHVKPNFVGSDPNPNAKPHSGEYALFVGRLSPEKGVETLLKAWEMLPVRVPLVIAGDGPMRTSLESQVAHKRLHSVSFVGQKKRHEIYDLLGEAAFLIVPSVWEEPFGLIIAEAFACGTPVLGASIGAIQEMVEDRITGLRFRPGDAADLADKVAWGWTHLPQLAVMGKAARQTYEERYTAETNYLLLMQIYASAIEAHFRSKRKRPLRVAA